MIVHLYAKLPRRRNIIDFVNQQSAVRINTRYDSTCEVLGDSPAGSSLLMYDNINMHMNVKSLKWVKAHLK